MIVSPRHPYSGREAAILGVLLRHKRLTTTKIAEKVYPTNMANAKNALLVTVNLLRDKMIRNGEPVRLRKSRRSGNRPIEIWLSEPYEQEE